MIHPNAELTIKRLPLSAIRVTEYQPRYVDRLLHYIGLLQDSQYADHSPGVLSVMPCPDGAYALLDGHHRFCAYVIAGRAEALCLVIDEREEIHA